MQRFTVSPLLCLAILHGCVTQETTQAVPDKERNQYAAASRCMELATHTEKVQVPSGFGMTAVEIHIVQVAAIFGQCMESAGYPPPKADPEPYLAVARECLRKASGAAQPDAVYSDCVAASGIGIEVETIEPPR